MDLFRRAGELYRAGRMFDALEAAQAACEHAPKDAPAWHLLAKVARHCHLPAASDDAFRRAASLDPALRPPLRLSETEFRQLLDEIAPGVAIEVRSLPTPEQVRAGLDPDSVAAPDAETGQVTLFGDNLTRPAPRWRSCGNTLAGT